MYPAGFFIVEIIKIRPIMGLKCETTGAAEQILTELKSDL